MAAHRVKVLVIDKDAGFLEEAAMALSGHFTVHTSSTGADGLKLFAQVRPQVVIADSELADVSFADLLNDLKGLDAGVLRIATSRDYSAIESVMQAIDTSHIHKYFRKPINFVDLVETINARTVSYQVGRGVHTGADAGPAYKRLHTIVDKAKENEKLGRTLELQLTKVREVEAESFGKVRDAVEEVRALRKKAADKDAVIDALQAQSLELEQLKKRDIDRVEQERETLRRELRSTKEECDKLSRENRQVVTFKAANDKLLAEAEAVRVEIADLRVSVSRDREAMVADMAQERQAVLDELALRKDEAERIIEIQKERNTLQLQAMQDAFEAETLQATQELQRLEADFENDRAARLAEVEAGRKRLAEELTEVETSVKRVETELARKKSEAERTIGLQRERNKAEMEALHSAFKQEQEHAAWYQIEQLKAELEQDRQAKLAEVEADRKRGEENLEAIRVRMTEERAQLEESVKEQREKAEADIQRVKDLAANERKKLTDALEADLAARKSAVEADLEQLKATATRELDRFKVTVQKNEREMADAVTQAKRLAEERQGQLALVEHRVRVLEFEIEQVVQAKQLVAQELESVRADYDVVVRSREALRAEVAELRERLT